MKKIEPRVTNTTNVKLKVDSKLWRAFRGYALIGGKSYNTVLTELMSAWVKEQKAKAKQ